MNLWIRSQNRKELLPASIEGLYIANGFTDDNNSYVGIKNKGHVGVFSTEERALEVLDEIQKLLTPKIDIKAFDIEQTQLMENHKIETIFIPRVNEFAVSQYNTFVYEMPKE